MEGDADYLSDSSTDSEGGKSKQQILESILYFTIDNF